MQLVIRPANLGLLIAVAWTTAPAAEPPISQNPEKQAQQYRELLEWNRKSLGGAYEKIGKKSPKWDKPAREALEKGARFFGRAVDPVSTEEEFYTLAKQAIDAGCDDPMILYLYARGSVGPNFPGREESDRRAIAAAVALERSAYPAFLKASSLLRAVQVGMRRDATPEQRAEAGRYLDAVAAVVPQAGATDDSYLRVENEWYHGVLSPLLGSYRQLGGDYLAAFNKVDAVLAKEPALKVMRLQLKGDFLTRYGWEARGAGVASTVTEEGEKLFTERLTEADKTLKEAWALKPTNARTAALMLTVVRGLGAERDEMERWFARAMENDGNNYLACSNKMEWLEPKWYGSRDDLLAFGRACRATNNWRAGLTLFLPDAHLRASRLLEGAEERTKYFASKDVWDDIHPVYAELLLHYTTNSQQRSVYAAFCTLCGRYDLANEQFQMVGDNLSGNAYIPLAMMKQLKDYAASRAK